MEDTVSQDISDSDVEYSVQTNQSADTKPDGEPNKIEVDNVDIKEENTPIVEDSGDRITESPTTGDSAWNNTKCVFCTQCLAATDEPKLLECLHSACNSCIKSKFSEQNQNNSDVSKGVLIINCAICKIACRKTQIIDNRFLIEINEDSGNEANKNEDLKCNSCTDNEGATSWCVECSEYICNKCVQAHKRLKITKDHTIKPKEEAEIENQSNLSGSKNLFCLVHPNEQLTLFCENCDILTCRDCQLTDHRDHKYKFTHEIASETKTFISGMLKDVSYKRVLLDSAMKVIDDRQNLICEKKTALVKEITQMVVKLTNTINIRGKELIHRLNEVCDTKQKTLQEKKAALQQLSQLTDHCIVFVETALDKGSDMAILFSKRHLINYLQRIKCRRADIPNPEIPVRIHLALDKVPDLIKVLSSIGAIVVDGKVYPPSSSTPTSNNVTPATSPVQRTVPPSTSPHGVPRLPPPYPHTQIQPLHQQQIIHQPQHQLPQHQLPQSQHQQSQHQQSQHLQSQQQQSHQQTHQQSHQQTQLHQHPHQQSQHPNNSMVSQSMLMQNRTSTQHSMQRPPALVRHQQHPMQRMPNAGQQQVSSSTHPQVSMNMADRNQLRMLQPKPVYVQTAPGVYQAVQSSYVTQTQYSPQQRFVPQQQLQYNHQNRLMSPNVTINRSNHTESSMLTMMAQGYHNQFNQAQNAKWHIPQQSASVQPGLNYGGNRQSMPLKPPDDSFKITLKPRLSGGNMVENKVIPAAVTSTIPKTPSPNLGKGDENERSLDKFCEESVNDLMATIAKLDSNGVQVLAEGRSKTGGSPHVDSSTTEEGTGKSTKSQIGDMEKDDPNEDWCAVCMDGGELVCCDKCPKVFHQNCHIPPLSIEESDTWQCLLCMNFADVPDNALGERRDNDLSPREKKIAERLILELYCQYEPSLHFREIISAENTYYHSIIKNPISLEVIKQKLNWNSESHYTNMEQLLRDVRLLFGNAYLYNSEDSTVYKDAKKLETFFDQQLEKWMPAYAYENPYDEEDEIFPPSKKYRRIIAD